eukprot:CAMPEP_0195629252 /NCGR_PEP_ID=MMETSP0815-20121206/19893_1 /TAXON_ID=97485 /ORGANISM="Prymnesium parvum, Strain Texoma1" /LENGTH=61 /DNA_ID=CAMNT_0040770595 /DNA_START=146 /DNA_END=331 /DNA_ORIENTATION=-
MGGDTEELDRWQHREDMLQEGADAHREERVAGRGGADEDGTHAANAADWERDLIQRLGIVL